MSKITLIPTLIFTLFLTACGQKGALYLLKNPDQPLIQPSDNGTDTLPNQTIPNATINTQNPNILPTRIPLQDKPNEF